MIINKGSVNTCVFSLSEKTTLDPVYYLFAFTNSQDNKVKYFLATDISTNKQMYNEFQIEETASEDLLNGKIELDLLGSYTYQIFEQSSTTNLDPDLTGGLVEIGRIDVIDTPSARQEFTSTRTIKVFNGN